MYNLSQYEIQTKKVLFTDCNITVERELSEWLSPKAPLVKYKHTFVTCRRRVGPRRNYSALAFIVVKADETLILL